MSLLRIIYCQDFLKTVEIFHKVMLTFFQIRGLKYIYMALGDFTFVRTNRFVPKTSLAKWKCVKNRLTVKKCIVLFLILKYDITIECYVTYK